MRPRRGMGAGPTTAARWSRTKESPANHPRRNPDSSEHPESAQTLITAEPSRVKSNHRVHVIDSHTGGEPTRVVVAGGPDLGIGPLSERLSRFRDQHDHFRSAIVNEPRGSD